MLSNEAITARREGASGRGLGRACEGEKEDDHDEKGSHQPSAAKPTDGNTSGSESVRERERARARARERERNRGGMGGVISWDAIKVEAQSRGAQSSKLKVEQHRAVK